MVSRRIFRQLAYWLLCLYWAALSVAVAAPGLRPGPEHHAAAGMQCHEQHPVDQHHADCSASCLLGCLLSAAAGPAAEPGLARAAGLARLHGSAPSSRPALAVPLCAPLPARGPPFSS